ncbi:ABC transporter permease [Rubellimicrobium arenae]|uniref:ABC transporter permease n=1 Tax=Rubellimicrobium arenae TaxID=2817372 RepID=UPI001B30D4E2|nr:iron ABC transporter permease [Rubellimicrobium arenae]
MEAASDLRLTPGGVDRIPWHMRLRYRMRVASREPTTLIGLLLAALFAVLIVVPIVSILLDAVQTQFGDERRTATDVGGWTGYYLHRTFAAPVARDLFWEPLLNTITVALGAIAVAVVLGTSLAWLVTRTDMWGRRWFATALIVPYMLPAWTFALAWTTIFKNRTVGGGQGWLEALGVSPPDWLAYGRVPIVIILALHYTPFVVLLFGSALRRFDSQLEDSARILGAGSGRIAWAIILPLMRPALLSSTILIFAKCLGEFGVPYVLGLPVNFDLLSTSLYQSIASRQTGVAGVLAAVIMAIGILSLLVDALLVREARRFVTVGSKGSMNRLSRLGRMRPVATGFCGLVFLVSVGLPVLTLALSTVMRVPGRFAWSNFTLDYWVGTDLETLALRRGILLTPDLWEAAWNTLRIVGLGVSDLWAPGAPRGRCGRADAAPAPVNLPPAGDVLPLPGTRHRLCRGRLRALHRPARAAPGAVWDGRHPDPRLDRRSDAVCLPGGHLGHDAARQRTRRGGAVDCTAERFMPNPRPGGSAASLWTRPRSLRPPFRRPGPRAMRSGSATRLRRCWKAISPRSRPTAPKRGERSWRSMIRRTRCSEG